MGPLRSRPPLPVRHANPHVPATLKSGALPPVKYQILNCQGQDILVGRLKIETPTPTGHAFILRRYDTGAVSLTTMYRAAFPNAPDQDEKGELQWVKDTYDLSGNNGGPHNPAVTRLAGTWVSPTLAMSLGQNYALGELIKVVVEATPDPSANYRRSQKSSASAATTVTKTESVPVKVVPVSNTSPTASLPTPSPTASQPNPPKRRKESSPLPSTASPPTSPAKTHVRRSSRGRSPVPRPTAITRTPKSTRTTRREEGRTITPGEHELAAVDEEAEVVLNGVTGSELLEQDIAEQQALVKKLKAERDAKEAADNEQYKNEDEDMEDGSEAFSTKLKKRTREDEEEPETITFAPKEREVSERTIATNNRVQRSQLQPRTKQLAWGAAAFAFGLSAVAFLPNFL